MFNRNSFNTRPSMSTLNRNFENGIELSQLKTMVPSVFAEHAHPDMSSRYKFYSTGAVVEGLMNEGWVPVNASENRIRKAGKDGFQRHMVQFKRSGLEQLKNVNDVAFMIWLINAHDGTSAYKLVAGLYRKVCSNGLIVCDNQFQAISVRHNSRATTDDVIDASYRIIETVPAIEDRLGEMQGSTPNEAERIAFARAALELRWQSEETTNSDGSISLKRTAPIEAERLLVPNRYRQQDHGKDLFTTYNVVQEHLIKGGDKGQTQNGNPITTREVNSVTENVRLNRALWVLTQEFNKLKQA